MKLLFSRNKHFRMVEPPEDMPLSGGYVRELTEAEEQTFLNDGQSGKAWRDTEEGVIEQYDLPVEVPTEATNYQVKQALNQTPADRAAVDALVDASTDQNTRDGWADASSFKRNNPLFAAAITYLGWSEQKVDDLFILAVTFK